MRILIISALLVCSSLAARAETIIKPDDFQRFTEGTTLYFERGGQPYGAEQYLENYKVIWTFLDGECQRGVWFPNGDNICFYYENDSAPQCWNFYDTDRGKSARVLGDGPNNDLIVVDQTDEPLKCPGPDVGVSYTPVPGRSLLKQ